MSKYLSKFEFLRFSLNFFGIRFEIGDFPKLVDRQMFDQNAEKLIKQLNFTILRSKICIEQIV